MKKITYLVLALLTMGLGFAACGDEPLVDNTPVTGTPEKDVEGIYVGKWVRILDLDTVSTDGKLGLTADSSYYVDVTLYAASAVGLDSLTSVANVVQEGRHGYVFMNMAGDKNGLGVSFRGKVFDNNASIAGVDSVMISFVKTVKVGRKAYAYNFKFTGTKQEN